MTSLTVTPEKPLLRGVSHQVSFFVALVAGTVLTVLTREPLLRWAVGIYSIGLAALFGISALYHRPAWKPRARLWMRRLDHAGIFVMIAGTGTPLAAAMAEPFGRQFFLVMWAGAALGVVRALFWVTAPKPLVSVLALALGWVVWGFRVPLEAAMPSGALTLIVVGGIIYSLGALVYAAKRPDPWPRVFGYHEVFHALTIVAAVLHFVAIAWVAAQGHGA